jgi:hypothetical protein
MAQNDRPKPPLIDCDRQQSTAIDSDRQRSTAIDSDRQRSTAINSIGQRSIAIERIAQLHEHALKYLFKALHSKHYKATEDTKVATSCDQYWFPSELLLLTKILMTQILKFDFK